MRLGLLKLWGVVVLLCLAAWPLSASGGADKRILFRISLENASSHIQVRAVRHFANAVNERFRDRLQVLVYDTARLFRDRDVFGALVEGKVEMAVPGTWHIAKYEPGVNVFLLPLFYGRSAAENHAVLAGEVGRELNRRIEDSLDVVVPGKWLDLGHANLYSLGRRIASPGDLRHLKIRVAGGLANALRIRAMGGESVIVPWPDLPLWLERRKIDGLLTTHETIRSARLWEQGLQFCLEDQEYFPMYVPIVSARLWRLLPEEVSQTIRQLWDETADWERKMAVQAQQEARAELEAHGMEIIVPEQDAIQQWRAQLLARQQEIMEKVGVDAGLYQQAAGVLQP